MKDFTISFSLNGTRYSFDAQNIYRYTTDGAGNPLYYVRAFGEDGTQAVVNLTPDWTIRSAFICD